MRLDLKHFGVATLIILLVTIGAAIAQAEDDFFTFDGGKYRFEGPLKDILVVYPDQPLMTDRLATYGIVKRNKDGSREFDKSQENKVTPFGRQMYDKLMVLDYKGFWPIFAVTLEYHRVTVLKYQHVSWDPILDSVIQVFNQVEKK